MDKFENAQSYIDFVKHNLEPLAQQLKVGVDFLWNILVQQARVEGVIYLIICVSLMVTTGVLVRIFLKNLNQAQFGTGSSYGRSYVWVNKKDKRDIRESIYDIWEDRSDYEKLELDKSTNRQGLMTIISGSLGVLFMVLSVSMFASHVPTIVTGLMNPEYRAIEKIVEFAKPNVEKVTNEVKKEESK